MDYPIDKTLSPVTVDKKTSQSSGISTTCPIVSGTSHDSEINASVTASVNSFAKDIAGSADTVDFSIKYNNKGILSILVNGYSSKNGSSGVIRHLALNFNIASGREIELESLFDNASGDWNKAVSEQLNTMAQLENIDLYNDIDDISRTSFYLTENSITFIFALYQIAPYPAGEPTFTLDYVEVRRYASSSGAIGVIMS